MLALYKLVVRDSNGKVIQTHERYDGSEIRRLIIDECEKGYSVTVTKL